VQTLNIFYNNSDSDFLFEALVDLFHIIHKVFAILTVDLSDKYQGVGFFLFYSTHTAFGILFAACLTGFAISRRSYDLIVEGDTLGAVLLEGTVVSGRTRSLRPEFGPYRLALIRKVRDDLPAGSLGQSELHLYAVAQEDSRADEALRPFLRTQLLVIDKDNEPEILLDVPECLPGNAEAVMNSLRTSCNGTLEKVRGGGFVLHLPSLGRQR